MLQPEPAIIVTFWEFVTEVIVAPLAFDKDHAYEVIPAGAEYVLDDIGHTVSLESDVMPQGTVGVTVKITSLYDSQPFSVFTVKRIVALELDTLAVVVKEVSSRNVTLPLTTVHFMLVTESPGLGVATPAN